MPSAEGKVAVRKVVKVECPCSVAFEELNGSFVILSRLEAFKCSEILALSCFWIFLARVETILSRVKLSDHCDYSSISARVRGARRLPS
jgi:hypothetical protein